MKKTLVVFVVCLGQCFAAESKQMHREAATNMPDAMLRGFIRAFDALDWESFRSFFANDATVFYPRGFTRRASGRSEFEANFRKVFEQIRAGRTQPPYLDIQPRDLQIQRFGDVAIVTFHLDDRPGVLNRRTLVLRKMKGQWKIVHLHASETPLSP